MRRLFLMALHLRILVLIIRRLLQLGVEVVAANSELLFLIVILRLEIVLLIRLHKRRATRAELLEWMWPLKSGNKLGIISLLVSPGVALWWVRIMKLIWRVLVFRCGVVNWGLVALRLELRCSPLILNIGLMISCRRHNWLILIKVIEALRRSQLQILWVNAFEARWRLDPRWRLIIVAKFLLRLIILLLSWYHFLYSVKWAMLS